MKKFTNLIVIILIITVGAVFAGFQTANYHESGNLWVVGGGSQTGELMIDTAGSFIFEGATANAYETTVAVTDPTADRTFTIPNSSGTAQLDTCTVVADTDGKTVTAAEAGNVINVNGGAGVWALPEASTVIGKIYRFAVAHGSNMDINPADADQILGLTNAAGDSIRNATAGGTVTLVAIDAVNWVVLGSYGTWADNN